MTEAKLQADCTQWFWNEYHSERQMLHHNDNNSENRIKGAIKKALGVVEGVSDLELITPIGKVIFIELKLPGEIQSKAQIKFMYKVQDRGHIYVIIYTFEEFKNFIKEVYGY